MEKEEYSFYKPVIDLFVVYINENYKKEIETVKFLKTLTHNLTRPHLWFPEARSMNRNIYLHIGDTHLGKSTFTLNLLEKSETGIFLTQNKHLAFEVYEKLKLKRNSSFLSEEESINSIESTHISSIISMFDLTKSYKCAVIDEIHLISDSSVGYCFTNAILGLKCDEIHLCVDNKSINLINNLCKELGDNIQILKHNIISESIIEDENVQSVSKLRDGDCIVVEKLEEAFAIKKVE